MIKEGGSMLFLQLVFNTIHRTALLIVVTVKNHLNLFKSQPKTV